MSYLSDMDDIDMTCSDFVNPLKMLKCSVKHTKKVVIDRWPTI